MAESKITTGLKKTRESFVDRISALVNTFRKVDKDFLEELEEVLILSDMGVDVSSYLIEQLTEHIKQNKIESTQSIKQVLAQLIAKMLKTQAVHYQKPTVLLIVGVNGVGKTTVVGKMAYMFKKQGKRVVLAAADTFRAAASEQLAKWAKRANVPVVKHHEGADPSAVVFDAVQSAKAKKADILICDTAGRLHNKKNLMAELDKINRVLGKAYAEAHLQTFLVLDATTGQNAIDQAKAFKQSVNVNGIILTKLDGTAKGGVVCGIRQSLGLPVYYIGVGEDIEDLLPFDATAFAHGLLFG